MAQERIVQRVPLIENYDPTYGLIQDGFVDPTTERKAFMSRMGIVLNFHIGKALIGVLPGSTYNSPPTIDEVFVFDAPISSSVPGIAGTYSIIVGHANQITPTPGQLDYFAIVSNVGGGGGGGPVFLGSSLVTTVVQIAPACNPAFFFNTVTSIASGGAGNNLNDLLNIPAVSGSSVSTPAQLKVTGVAGGVVTSVSVNNNGSVYGIQPTNPVQSTNITTGGATAPTFNLTWNEAQGVIVQLADPINKAWFVGVTAGGAAVSGQLPALPAQMVPSVACLNNYNFYLDVLGNIWNTNPGDVTTINGLSFVQAFSTQSILPVTLATHSGYLVGFSDVETRYFYVTGATNGSSIAPVQNVTFGIGCSSGLNPLSVQAPMVAQQEEILAWLESPTGSNANAGSLRVWVFQPSSQVPQRISSPLIERLLQGTGFINASFVRFSGHTALCLSSGAKAFIYDFETQLWYQWNPGPNNAGHVLDFVYTFGSVTYSAGVAAASSTEIGDFYLMVFKPTGYDQPFPATQTAFTPTITMKPLDMGVMNYKQWESITPVGDQVSSSSPVTITYNDNDGIGAFSSGRTVDLSVQNPVARNLGSSRRRVWRLAFTASSTLRQEAAEIAAQVGSF